MTSGDSAPVYRQFVQGGLAAVVGASASHPLDLVKVRMQIQSDGAGVRRLGPVDMARSIYSSDGVPGLFKGLSASAMRQAVYSSARFGIYDTIKLAISGGKRDLSLLEKVGAGLAAGGIGAAIANPCDVTMVRMQADGKLPLEARRNYKNAVDGLLKICRSEGVGSLWQGCCAAVVRAMIVTASQFAAYDQIKETMIHAGAPDSTVTHLSAGFSAGFVASCTSTPVDTVKTRLMNSRPGEYSGPLDCAVRTVRNEGAMALYKGFVPTFVRQAPYLVVMFVTLEQLKVFFRWVDNRNASSGKTFV